MQSRYYDGWAHNKAHKINKKVIVPCYGIFSDKRWGAQRLDRRMALNTLQDIEKCLNYLDGGMTREVNLYKVIESLDEYDPGKNIECKYFTVTFYKKGTCHIVFTNLELLEKFNIYAAQNKNWLPPNYGKTKYSDMSAEEQGTVDKLPEISTACERTILAGTAVTLSTGEKQFSYTEKDQLNISEMFSAVLMGATSYPYHEDGGLCEMFTAADIVAIYTTLSMLKTSQLTYHNQLKHYMESLDTPEAVLAVTYGQELTGEYLDSYNTIVAQTQAQLEAILAKLGGGEQ